MCGLCEEAVDVGGDNPPEDVEASRFVPAVGGDDFSSSCLSTGEGPVGDVATLTLFLTGDSWLFIVCDVESATLGFLTPKISWNKFLLGDTLFGLLTGTILVGGKTGVEVFFKKPLVFSLLLKLLPGDTFPVMPPPEGDLVAMGEVATLTEDVTGLDLLCGGLPVWVEDEQILTDLLGDDANGDTPAFAGDKDKEATGDIGEVPCEDIEGFKGDTACLCTDMFVLDGDVASVTFAAASCCEASNLLEIVLIHLGLFSERFADWPSLLVVNTEGTTLWPWFAVVNVMFVCFVVSDDETVSETTGTDDAVDEDDVADDDDTDDDPTWLWMPFVDAWVGGAVIRGTSWNVLDCVIGDLAFDEISLACDVASLNKGAGGFFIPWTLVLLGGSLGPVFGFLGGRPTFLFTGSGSTGFVGNAVCTLVPTVCSCITGLGSGASDCWHPAGTWTALGADPALEPAGLAFVDEVTVTVTSLTGLVVPFFFTGEGTHVFVTSFCTFAGVGVSFCATDISTSSGTAVNFRFRVSCGTS